MATTRQDAWTDDEDLLLAEVVLRHIREGGTQLSAFKEVGRHLSRTPAACGFRWNSYVRKQHRERIEEAKQLRKVENYEVKETKIVEAPTSLTLNDVIDFLQSYKNEKDSTVLQQQIESLQTERARLLERLSVYEEEYRTLLDYIDQKRSVMVLEGKERDVVRANEKLEKLKK
ncbi:RsfA family transcriptional regulator [Bacillus cereus]|uniref:RsfA family transcriptional regulator n=1 Tax=Bacillus paramycoides TaxID=2026194 RepID=A0ABU6MU99_9BACI|nr:MULTISPECIES: RsfA family transcriptional regulator [Bacillus cereus group]PFD46058.1 RsfA family transcriptional regulator [Bacillus cereus]MED0959398.1 RsfA family transcriptional regulator [Bacillus paramycoides]MED0978882.1 RsfA family transcriptional regulator [Bacillus paramycoides]MED0983562.1 RsfA family transcriptional regulator [Bacillus paramycoides]MED1090529.1 RsfA family transcriptional regulator [Bacillus paramycoides]